MKQLHFYSFSLMAIEEGAPVYISAYLGLDTPQVRLEDIAIAKHKANCTNEAVLLACCYLGQMTEEKFNE